MKQSTIKSKQDKQSQLQTWSLDKERLCNDFIDNRDQYINLITNQGDVFYCYMGENIGEEQCKYRPVVVVSKNLYNQNSSQVTIVPLSTTIKTKTFMKNGKRKRKLRIQTHFLLKQAKFQFLTQDSVAVCEQIKAVSKARLTHKLGSLDNEAMEEIKKRFNLLLDL